MSEEVYILENVKSLVEGTAIPKMAADQNTDDIMPARYLKEITFEHMGEYAFIDERLKEGQRDPSHPFNDPKYQGGTILVAGANFGCGSSREHAPQGLHRFGIEAIIAPSFAEIFAGNCASLGVVAVTADQADVEGLAEYVAAHPKEKIGISLEGMKANYGAVTFDIAMPEGRRKAFLNGTWDAMAVLQQDGEGIARTAKGLDYLAWK